MACFFDMIDLILSVVLRRLKTPPVSLAAKIDERRDQGMVDCGKVLYNSTKMNKFTDPIQNELCLQFYHCGRYSIRQRSFPELFVRPFTAILVVESGILEIAYGRGNRSRMTLQPGEVCVCPATIPRCSRSTGPVDVTVSLAAYAFEMRGGIDLLALAEAPFGLEGRQCDRIAALVRELVREEARCDCSALRGHVSRQRLGYALLEELLAEFQPQMPSLAWQRLLPVTTWICEHLTEPLDLPALQAMSALSRTHFFRLFKEQTGKTPGEFQTGRRLAEAQRLLRESDLPIGQVGAVVGWPDPFYFSKRFKQGTGFSPSAYRHRAADL
jgi:AraC family transcriptional regulator of arabinose operon